jgi:hypothetical protein
VARPAGGEGEKKVPIGIVENMEYVLKLPEDGIQQRDETNFIYTYSRDKQMVKAVPEIKSPLLFLPWKPGYISEIERGGQDVLSGPFSGCYFVKYKKGGMDYVGHIGTDLSPTSNNSIQVKAAWNAFASRSDVRLSCGFNPIDQLNLACFQIDQLNKELKLAQPISYYGRCIYAIITNDDICYCVPALKCSDNIVFLKKEPAILLDPTRLKNIFVKSCTLI